MSSVHPASIASCRARSAAVAVVVLISVALVSVIGHAAPSERWSSSAPSAISIEPLTKHHHDRPLGDLGHERSGGLGVAGGDVPDGVTVFDNTYPAVANLDSTLLAALRDAATDAAGDAVEFFVNSGWRSPEYQEQLLDEAVATYGSREEAARWVATPARSAHVSGGAVDIGSSDAQAWLSRNGAEYGLCQIYGNEPWHFELRPEAINLGCPPPYVDATHDPRMQQ